MRPRYSAAELVGNWLDSFKVSQWSSQVRQEIEALTRLQASVEQ